MFTCTYSSWSQPLRDKTAHDQASQLMKQVIGTQHLVSSPALIESTSLLFTHGLDLFLTRAIAPSGTFDILTDSFNKVQLLLTLAGLSVGIAVAKPAVQRKMLNMRWY